MILRRAFVALVFATLASCSEAASDTPVPECRSDLDWRCDPATCQTCFEVVPGYSVCAEGRRDEPPQVSCNPPPEWAPEPAHECCATSECPTDQWCVRGVSDAHDQLPANRCRPKDECGHWSDCPASMICVPRFHYELTTHCEPAECVTAEDCEPGFICAPTVGGPGGNFAPMFTGVHCVPDPNTCAAPDAGGGAAGTG